MAGPGGRRPGVPRLQQVRGGVGTVWGCVGGVRFLGWWMGDPSERRDEQGRAGSRSRELIPGGARALGGQQGRVGARELQL